MLYYLKLSHKSVGEYYVLCLHDLRLLQHHHQYVQQAPKMNKKVEENENEILIDACLLIFVEIR